MEARHHLDGQALVCGEKPQELANQRPVTLPRRVCKVPGKAERMGESVVGVHLAQFVRHSIDVRSRRDLAERPAAPNRRFGGCALKL